MDSLQTSLLNQKELPLVIEPVQKGMGLQELLGVIKNKKEFFTKNLLKHGGLLFRNFPIENEHDFASLIKQLQLGNFINYIGGDSPRTTNETTNHIRTPVIWAKPWL